MATSDNSDAATYTTVNWNPLTEPDSFRLIILEAGQGDEPISCRLRVLALDSLEAQYLALSYTWGSSELTRTITCNEYTVRITENLHSALRRVRSPTLNLWLWCDALCIKQGDDPASLQEHAKQLPMMGRIFSSAVQVIVDLGGDDGTLDLAVKGINAILASDGALRLRCHLEPNPRAFLGLPEFTDPLWPALRSFTARPWFRRVWCVQEAVLARDIRVIFGPYSLTFEQLLAVSYVHLLILAAESRVHQAMTWDTYRWHSSMMASECLVQTFRKRKAYLSVGVGSWSVSLCDLLKSTMNQRSTDPRDRVYALFGMSGPLITRDLTPTYFESTGQVSQRLSAYLVRNGNGAWLLVHNGGIGDNRASWTIDLDKLGVTQGLDPLAIRTKVDGLHELYAAGGEEPPTLLLHAGDRGLEVQGVLADAIDSLTEAFTFPVGAILGLDGSTKLTFASFARPLITWLYSVVRPLAQDSTADPEELWRTLIGNYNIHLDDPERETNGRALPGFGRYFDELLGWVGSIVNADPPIKAETLTEADFAQFQLPAGAVKYWLALFGALLGRRIARTRSGALGLVPLSSIVGDIIAVFKGFPFPSCCEVMKLDIKWWAPATSTD